MSQYFKEEGFVLLQGNCLDELKTIEEQSVDLVFADPPYFLSNGGFSCKGGKKVSVNKGNWDKSYGFDCDYRFTLSWLSACKKVLKPNGSIWISGTLHSIYQIGFALEKLNYGILNEISWFKPNAPPNLSCRYFAHSHETLIWARREKNSYHKFNYELMKNWDLQGDRINHQGKQMRSVWSIPLTPPEEKMYSNHPTQKPIELLKRIIASCSNENDTVLDPFNGSGTTGIVSIILRRKYIGIDKDPSYLEMTKKRFFHTNNVANSWIENEVR
jgi:site-specific DNA-methyltransferase (adenine-specific)